MKKINGLPVYEAILTEENLGIFTVSLVDNPATEIGWFAFSKDQKQPLKFSITSEEEHKVLSVIMRADFPIYRRDEKGNGFYITFSKETLYEASKRMLANGFQNYVNLSHIESSSVLGFEMTQIFIKDSSKGISPAGFEDIEEGSLFGEYYVSDETLWQEIKDGKFTGLSLEGEFSIEEAKEPEETIDSIEDLLAYIEKNSI